MSRYLDPKADIVFKKIFGEHPKLLISSKDLLEVPEIAQAIELSEESAYTPGELSFYESYWDQVRREKTLFSAKYAEGLAEGLAEGEARGEARGEAKGRRETAKKLLRLNVSIDIVVESTALTREEVEAIKSDLDQSQH